MILEYIDYFQKQEKKKESSLVVQWLRLHAPNAGGLGSISGQGTRTHVPDVKTLHAATKNPTCHN